MNEFFKAIGIFVPNLCYFVLFSISILPHIQKEEVFFTVILRFRLENFA